MAIRTKIGEIDGQTDQETAVRAVDGLLATGGIIAALGASSCCVVPLLLFTLGVSGAWISNLTALAPHQPLFVAAAISCLAVGFVRIYRRPKGPCAEGTVCTRSSSSHLAEVGLWVAAVLVALAVAFPYLAPYFLET